MTADRGFGFSFSAAAAAIVGGCVECKRESESERVEREQ